MHPRRSSTTLLLVGVIVLAGLLAGCSGGGESGNGSQNDGSGGAKEKGGGAAKKGTPREKAIALGTIKRVKLDREKVFLKPNTEQQGKETMSFKIAKNATISLDDKETELADIKEGQQAQVEYIDREKVDLATTVKLFSTDEQPSGEGEETG